MQEARAGYPLSDNGENGCRQSSEAARTGSTSIVTSRMNLLIFMLIEIRLHANYGSRQWHFPQALALEPESFVRLNGWSA